MGSDISMMLNQGYCIDENGMFYKPGDNVPFLLARINELEEENLRLKTKLSKGDYDNGGPTD